MNPIAEDILSYIGSANDTESEEKSLTHYGMPRRSGRYPWGSGEDPYQHSIDFLGRVEEMRKNKFTYTDKDGKTWTGDNAIAKSMGLTSSEFRIELSLCNSERRMKQVARAQSLRDDGLGYTEIGRLMGVRESTVRSWLEEKAAAKMVEARLTADFIQDQVDKYGMVDVGKGAAAELRISNERMKEALYILENNGYPVYGGGIPNVTNPGKQLNQTVVCKPGTKANEIYDFSKVHALNEDRYITRDGGETFVKKFQYPASMDSKRMMIRYNEEGGLEKDGIVEIRRNVPDLSLGESRYAQVRILVKRYGSIF